MHVFKIWFVLLALKLSKNGAIELTCAPANPSVQYDVTCVCKRTSGTGIDWYLNDDFHSNCYLYSVCLPQTSGYLYGINSTKMAFEITMTSYNYSDCTKVSCKDSSDNSIERTMIPTSIKFDTKYQTSLTEPTSDDKNGAISVTTGCISAFSEVKYKWYIIVGGVEKEYIPDPSTVFDTADTSACSNCYTDRNGKRTIGFNHIEEHGFGTLTILFRVVLHHTSTNLIINLTTFKIYTVKDNISTKMTHVKDDQNFIPLVIVLSLFVPVIALVTVVVVVRRKKHLCDITPTSKAESQPIVPPDKPDKAREGGEEFHLPRGNGNFDSLCLEDDGMQPRKIMTDMKSNTVSEEETLHLSNHLRQFEENKMEVYESTEADHEEVANLKILVDDGMQPRKIMTDMKSDTVSEEETLHLSNHLRQFEENKMEVYESSEADHEEVANLKILEDDGMQPRKIMTDMKSDTVSEEETLH